MRLSPVRVPACMFTSCASAGPPRSNTAPVSPDRSLSASLLPTTMASTSRSTACRSVITRREFISGATANGGARAAGASGSA
eukprot:3644855-Prymnesium_polylepis.1